MPAKVLLTGCAGFIGYHLGLKLLELGYPVVGVDSVNDYYSPQLKEDRLEQLEKKGLDFRRFDLVDKKATEAIFNESFERVIHLAAQAGVRYSLTHPHVYAESNITGFLNILEGCRHGDVGHLIYASSSSVYGANTELPFSTRHRCDNPISLYGATKKANELMAHAYSANFELPTTGLRFFTVYGPWGRPDMALYLFARAILRDEPIKVFNQGKMRRDFTFVDDVVESIVKLLEVPPPSGREGIEAYAGAPSRSAPAEVFNIGNHSPVELMRFIELIETSLGRTAKKEFLPMQIGDVNETFADVEDFAARVGFEPKTPIEYGIRQSMDWFKSYTKERPLVFTTG